jgi:hypothetical protein
MKKMPMKKFSTIILTILAHQTVFADSESSVATSPTNSNATFIARAAYLQNPYNSENYPTTGGGTLIVNESQTANQNFWQKWFEDGTYNIYAGTMINAGADSKTFNNPGPYNRDMQPYSYGANIFAQTGQAAGFSIGGVITVMNPFFAEPMNGLATQQ